MLSPSGATVALHETGPLATTSGSYAYGAPTVASVGGSVTNTGPLRPLTSTSNDCASDPARFVALTSIETVPWFCGVQVTMPEAGWIANP